nr:immunoglobulin light chain junction region [Macaca mulatta]MOV79354.1 immunoglobulin light chain junction region [Macaca mulatta]
CQHSYETPFTF